MDKHVTPANYRSERIDGVSGSIWSNIVSIFIIIIATAAAIGGTGPVQSAQEAAETLRPAVGPAAPTLFAAGPLGASLLTASVVPLSSSYAIADAVGAPPVRVGEIKAGSALLRHLHSADRNRRSGGIGAR